MRRTIKAMAILLTLAGGIQAPRATWGQTPALELPKSLERLAPGPLPHLERVVPGALTPKEIYHKLLPSTCWVVHEERVGSNSGLSFGTGWVVDARRRLIVTNHHVVDGVDVVRVGFPIMKDGRVVNDNRSYFNGDNLIAGTVQVSPPRRTCGSLAKRPRRAVRCTRKPRAAQRVLQFGASPGDELLGLHQRNVRRSATLNGRIAGGRDRHAVRGNSGGPVVNDRGELVAVVEGCVGMHG
jgi:S1-C subfamily serine protease